MKKKTKRRRRHSSKRRSHGGPALKAARSLKSLGTAAKKAVLLTKHAINTDTKSLGIAGPKVFVRVHKSRGL